MAFLIKDYSGGAFITPSEDYYKHFGGTIKVDIWGTAGSGQINFEASPDNGTTWITLDLETDGNPAVFTDPKETVIESMPTGNLLRANFSGGTATDLNVKVS